MKRIAVMAGLVALAGCSGNSGPVGENSPDSIKTTAEGNVVATIPSPTPTPVTDNTIAMNLSSNYDYNAAASTAPAAAAEADNMAAAAEH